MKTYICQVCGYAYDEKEGDISQGIVAGTKFEDLPSSWVCPVCSVDTSNFNEI